MKKVIVIVGPTGSGKTKLSVELAKKIDAEIINGDSVQIYKKLNIGSAKIKPEEKQGVKHHLFDVYDPKESYSAYQFQKDVRKLLKNIKTPIIVGGTGLYIKAALYNYEFLDEEKDPGFDDRYAHFSDEALYQKLLKLDPFIEIDAKNRRRVLRALRQAELGQPRSEKNQKNQPLYELCIIYLNLERNVLEERLNLRLKKQLEDGFINEVKDLRKQNIHLNMIGYRELDLYLNGEITLDEAKERIIKVSKKLAKKQKTWFKNQMQVKMIDATSPTLIEDSYQLVSAFLNA